MSNFDLDKIRGLIKRCKWNWAVSMKDVPHEYIHRDKCELSRDEFYYIVSAQRELGIPERWGKYNFPYLYIDGYKYWTMGDPFETTWILNRQKVFNQFDFMDWPLKRIYSDEVSEIVNSAILDAFPDRKIFECGVGNGDFVTGTKIKPEKYYGVDPSKKAITIFRNNTSGFYRRCSTISFEEAINKWLTADSVVIALFGTASYFMHQYLRELSKSGLDYFLMFYKVGYKPDVYEEMYHFEYSLRFLTTLFPKAYVYIHNEYITLSSKQVKFKKPKQKFVENDLFDV